MDIGICVREVSEKVKADLHNHLSTRMYRGEFNPVIDTALNRLGNGAVLGLVNFSDTRYERFVQAKGYDRKDIGNAVYVPEKDVLVVKGQELKTKQGHILVLGLQKDVHLKEDRTLDDAIKESKDNNGIIIADHMFYKEGIGPFLEANDSYLKQAEQKAKSAPEERRNISILPEGKNDSYLNYLDAIEIFNGEASLWIPKLTPKNANIKAEILFRRIIEDYPNIGGISTSDGHSFYEIGRCYSYIDFPDIENSEKLAESFRKSIRECRGDQLKEHKRSSIWGRIGALDHLADLAAIIAVKKFLPNFADNHIKQNR